jgi:endonuclease G
MKIRPVLSFLVIFLCVPALTVYGDYLEVRRSATIKAEPNRDALILERVQSGTYLQLLNDGQQSNGYYQVETVSAGQPGWIYRTLVRRYRGEIPGPVLEGDVIDPLGDPTTTLTAEQRRYAAHHLRLGKPQAVYKRVRQGYVLAQDGRLKIPLWVQYVLTPDDLEGTVERSDDFRPDASIPFRFRAELGDYRGSGFDRGHMAPAADMRRSQQVMSESFLLSNMSPQIGVGFNRAIWADLEASVRGWVEQRGVLTIITGPVFAVEGNRVSYEVIGENQVAVPTHFYKIIVDANDASNLEALAFMMPNTDLGGHEYSEYLRTIDEIETATGLDFLSALPAAEQERLESAIAPRIW